MKLLRYGFRGEEKPVLLDEHGRIRDLSSVIPDISGESLAPRRLQELARLNTESLPLVAGKPRLGPPVAGIGKNLAIGFNYAEHATETGSTRDEVPDPQNLSLWLDLNGKRRQAGNTSTMIFGVAYLVSYS